MVKLTCTYQGGCTKEADFFVWFVGYGGLYAYRCAEHIIADMVEGLYLEYPLSQVSDNPQRSLT